MDGIYLIQAEPGAAVAVKRHAMVLAIAHFSRDWEQVIDMSERVSYDFFCRRGEEELRVEVKRTTGYGEKIILTKKEVEEASHPGYTLFLVSGITLDCSGNIPQASGGDCRIFFPWAIESHKLEPLSYYCELNITKGTIIG